MAETMNCNGAYLDLVKLYVLCHIAAMFSRGEHRRCERTAPFAADSGKAASTPTRSHDHFPVQQRHHTEKRRRPFRWSLPSESVRVDLMLHHRGFWDSAAPSEPVGKDLDPFPSQSVIVETGGPLPPSKWLVASCNPDQ